MGRPSFNAQFALIAILGLTMMTSGCQLAVNPFTDELSSKPCVTTPSVEGVRLVTGLEATDSRRPHESMNVTAADGTVTYGPLYFADPFEGSCCEDDEFSWTWRDYLLLFHGPTQFVVNGISWPISAVIAPPWRVMSSDAQPHWLRAGCIPFLRIDDGEPRGS